MDIVSTASMAAMGASAVLALALPLVLFAALGRRRKLRGFPLMVGAAAYVLFALVLERLLSAMLLAREPFANLLEGSPWVYAAFTGLLAGLVQEGGRLLAFAAVLRRRHSSGLSAPLAFGIGYGGAAATLAVFLPMAGGLILAALLNGPGADALAALIPGRESLLEEAVAALTGMTNAAALARGLEFALMLCFQLSVSVLVWMAATTRGPWWFFLLAILFHAAVRTPAALLERGVVGLWGAEGLLLAVVLLAGMTARRLFERSARSFTPLLRYKPSNFGI